MDTSSTTHVSKVLVKHRRPSCSSWAKIVWSPIGRIVVGRTIKVLLELGWEKVPNWREKRLFLYVYVDDLKLARNKTSTQCGKHMWKKSIWANQLPWPRLFGCTLRYCETSKDIVDNYRNMFLQEQKRSYLAQGNLTRTCPRGPMTWKVMQRNAWNDIANLKNRTTQQLQKVATPCLDDHQFKDEEMGSVGELPKVCSEIVLTCLYLGRIGRRDIYGRQTNLLVLSPNRPEHATTA